MRPLVYLHMRIHGASSFYPCPCPNPALTSRAFLSFPFFHWSSPDEHMYDEVMHSLLHRDREHQGVQDAESGNGSVTKRVLCIPDQSTYACKTQGGREGALSSTRGSRGAQRAIHAIARCAPVCLRS